MFTPEPTWSVSMTLRTTPGNRRGFGILWALLFIAGLEVCTATAGQMWSAIRATEREEELRFRLLAYHRAIAGYRQVFRRYPRSLQELVENPKGVKFLQRLYLDPVAQPGEERVFAAVPAPDGGVGSVRSRSAAAARNGSFYRDWRVNSKGFLREAPETESANGNSPHE